MQYIRLSGSDSDIVQEETALEKIGLVTVTLNKMFSILLLSLFFTTPLLAQQNSLWQPLQDDVQSNLASFKVSVTDTTQLSLNKLHSWTVVVQLSDTSLSHAESIYALTPEDINISGGMPAHAHGLPTQPKVSRLKKITPYTYELTISGLKFHMWGQWFIRIDLLKLKDYADIKFNLMPGTV